MGLWWQIVGAATFESQQNGFYCHKQILFGSPVWMSLSYDVPALEIHLVIHLEDILSEATVHSKRPMNCSLRRSVGWILDHSHAFVVLSFSWMCVSAYHLPSSSLSSCLLQARDDILNGSHPVSFDKACEFAGIQAQIQFGPHVEHKHKPGFLE